MARLTVKELEALRASAAGTKIRDDGGLVGSIRACADSVSVTFYWRYRFNGKVREYPCGTWPKESLADIRGGRDKARRLLDEGKDPGEEKRIARLAAKAEQAEAVSKEKARIAEVEAQKARLTIRELFDRWERRELTGRKDKGAEARRSFEKDVFPSLGSVAAEDVTRQLVVGILDSVVERGAPIVARELLGNLRQMFGFAEMRGLVERDPTSRLKRDDFGKKVERERVLTDAEIKLLPSKLKEARMADSNVAALWLMLSTCCRVGEISQAEWKDVRLDARTWRIPRDNSKNAREHTVYLSSFSVLQFEALKALAGESPWVLPARWTDKHVCPKSISKQLGDRQRGDKEPMACRSLHTNALELPGGKWTAHDLRRTGATLMGTLGVRPDVIEKCLNHVQQNKLIRIYQRQELREEQAEAWRILGGRLDLLLRADAGNVVALRGAA